MRSLLLFVLAAVAEIGGAWLIWQGVREQRGAVWIGAGIVALGAYGFAATLQPDPNFGRILAAYGGIFVAGALAWGVVVTSRFRGTHRPRRVGLSHGKGAVERGTRPLGLRGKTAVASLVTSPSSAKTSGEEWMQASGGVICRALQKPLSITP